MTSKVSHNAHKRVVSIQLQQILVQEHVTKTEPATVNESDF
jgi:hypothetical protein